MYGWTGYNHIYTWSAPIERSEQYEFFKKCHQTWYQDDEVDVQCA